MKISINIKVRNPDWYFEDEPDNEGMSREEYMMINGDKIPKHTHAWTYDFSFPVIKVTDNRLTNYDLHINNKDADGKECVSIFPIKNVTILEILGGTEKSQIIVSNEIIAEYFAHQNKKGVLYWYFYIKEGLDFGSIGDYIWLNGIQMEDFKKHILTLDKSAHIKFDEKVKSRVTAGIIPIYRDFPD